MLVPDMEVTEIVDAMERQVVNVLRAQETRWKRKGNRWVR